MVISAAEYDIAQSNNIHPRLLQEDTHLHNMLAANPLSLGCSLNAMFVKNRKEREHPHEQIHRAASLGNTNARKTDLVYCSVI